MTTVPSSEREIAGGARVPRRPRAPSLPRLQRLVDIPSRWTLLALGGWVAWRMRDAGRPGPWLGGIGIYALIAIVTSVYWLGRRSGGAATRAEAAGTYAAYATDALFAAALIWLDGGLGSPLYILLVLLSLKAAGFTPLLPGMVWASFAFGPLYVLALRLAAGNFAFLADSGFLSRYILLWAWLIGVVLLAWELKRRTIQAAGLDRVLAQQQADLAQKTEVLQRTATDLGDRVLELRALQEVAKALATTLRAEETPHLVVETLRNITGSSHCAVGLFELNGTAAGAWLEGAVMTADQLQSAGFRFQWAEEPVLSEALATGRPARLDPSATGQLRGLLGGYPYFVTPLISRGQPIGALFVADHPAQAETPAGQPGSLSSLNVSEQLLTSFAYFAATATENAQLYQDAWEKRRELEAVLSGIGDGVVVVDPDLALILMNPVARDILGLQAEPPVGAALSPYLAPHAAAPDAADGTASAFAALLTDTLRSGREQIRELELPGHAGSSAFGGHGELGREGSTRTYGALASPVLNAGGEAGGVVAVLRDITAQKELERMKSNFLSVVSHELRTPLHSIKGFVEIILMGKTGPVSELQEDFLRTVSTQTTVLQRMIDDLLELSRMEAGRIRLQLSEVSLPLMARNVATKLAPLAEEAGLQLHLDFQDDLPEIDGDRIRLEQVLTNLVENAIKFTPDGGRITLSGQRIGDRVHVSIADTGIGIPPDEQEKVFDRFYQVDGSERRAYRGTGLGLSISRHIVERHGGRIWVESEGINGRGSCFHIELPIELRLTEAPTIDFITPTRGG